MIGSFVSKMFLETILWKNEFMNKKSLSFLTKVTPEEKHWRDNTIFRAAEYCHLRLHWET